MFGLLAGFAMRMCKRDANAQEETTPSLEVPSDKCSKLSRIDEKV